VNNALLALDALCGNVACLDPMQQDGERKSEALGHLLHEEVGIVTRDVFAQLDDTTWRVSGRAKSR